MGTPIFLLLVTWLSGNAASTYQVQFKTLNACDYATRALKEDARRINAEAPDQHIIVSAVCVDQQKG